MSHTSGAPTWERYLRACVLHYYRAGVLYHHAISDLIQRDLIVQGVPVSDSWGVLVGDEYEYDEERYVAEVLKARGYWDGDESETDDGNNTRSLYDRYSDEETVCHDLWNAGERDISVIAAKILLRYPSTEWFGTSAPANKVLEFLHESGRILKYLISVSAYIYPFGVDECYVTVLSTGTVGADSDIYSMQ